jgi:hypothetical protein
MLVLQWLIMFFFGASGGNVGILSSNDVGIGLDPSGLNNSLTSGITSRSSYNNVGRLHIPNPDEYIVRIEQENGTIQTFVPNNPPNKKEEFSRLIIIGRQATESWVFTKFLASVFECQIDWWDTDRYMMSKVWRQGYSWEIDSNLLRQYLKSFPNNLYERLRTQLGYRISYKAYPPALDQEVLLGQWDPTRRNRNDIIFTSTLELYEHFLTYSTENTENDASLVGIRVVGNRLCDAVHNLKLKLASYRVLYGDDVTFEGLANVLEEGIVPPFSDIRDETPLPNYNVGI